MQHNRANDLASAFGVMLKSSLLVVSLLMISSCGVKNGNEFLDVPENIADASDHSVGDGPWQTLVCVIGLTLTNP